MADILMKVVAVRATGDEDLLNVMTPFVPFRDEQIVVKDKLYSVDRVKWVFDDALLGQRSVTLYVSRLG